MKNNFNLMRLVMALTVMFSHSFALVGSALSFEQAYTMRWETGLGGLAVHVFFAISGYLIAGSFLNSPKFPIFLLHRSLRLLPALIAAIPFAWWSFQYFDGYAGNPVTMFNASLWTLSWEGYCYIGIGVLGVLGILNRQSFSVILAILILNFVWRIPLGTGAWFRGQEPMILFFAMGTFIRLNEKYINMRKAAIIGAAVTFCAFAPAVFNPILWVVHSISETYVYRIDDYHLHYAAYIFSAPFFIIYLCRYTSPVLNFKTDISYGVYLYAWPVGSAVVFETLKRGIHLNGMEAFLVSLPFVLLLAFASCKLIEEPAMKLKKLLRPPANVSAQNAPATT